jgi:hypothetical protein
MRVALNKIEKEVYEQEHPDKETDEYSTDNDGAVYIRKNRWCPSLRAFKLYDDFGKIRKKNSRDAYLIPEKSVSFVKWFISLETTKKFNRLRRYQVNNFTDEEVINIITGFYDLLKDAGFFCAQIKDLLQPAMEMLDYHNRKSKIDALSKKMEDRGI